MMKAARDRQFRAIIVSRLAIIFVSIREQVIACFSVCVSSLSAGLYQFMAAMGKIGIE